MRRNSSQTKQLLVSAESSATWIWSSIWRGWVWKCKLVGARSGLDLVRGFFFCKRWRTFGFIVLFKFFKIFGNKTCHSYFKNTVVNIRTTCFEIAFYPHSILVLFLWSLTVGRYRIPGNTNQLYSGDCECLLWSKKWSFICHLDGLQI
jgi:hypothetical protein